MTKGEPVPQYKAVIQKPYQHKLFKRGDVVVEKAGLVLHTDTGERSLFTIREQVEKIPGELRFDLNRWEAKSLEALNRKGVSCVPKLYELTPNHIIRSKVVPGIEMDSELIVRPLSEATLAVLTQKYIAAMEEVYEAGYISLADQYRNNCTITLDERGLPEKCYLFDLAIEKIHNGYITIHPKNYEFFIRTIGSIRWLQKREERTLIIPAEEALVHAIGAFITEFIRKLGDDAWGCQKLVQLGTEAEHWENDDQPTLADVKHALAHIIEWDRKHYDICMPLVGREEFARYNARERIKRTTEGIAAAAVVQSFDPEFKNSGSIRNDYPAAPLSQNAPIVFASQEEVAA